MFNIFKTKIIFIPDYDANIGNLSEKIFYVLHKAKRENKKIIFIKKKLFFKFLFKKIRYKQLSGLFLLESNHIDKSSFFKAVMSNTYGFIFSLHVVYRAFLYATKLSEQFTYKLFGIGNSNLINIFDEKVFDTASVDKIDWRSLYQDQLDLSFSNEDEIICTNNMIKMGINKDDWYICLHIRTPFYHGDLPQSEYRNSLPENYRKAIDYIHKLGGKVVRLGDPVEMAINNLCIDYPNSSYKSELMDLHIIKNCKFYIGTNSGILDTAFLFGVPVLGVNFSDFCLTIAFKEYDKVLYKHIVDKKTDQELSITEIFNQPMYVNPNINQDFLNKFFDNYYIYENTEEEIYLAVKEMIEDLQFPKAIDKKNILYREMVRNSILRWIEQEEDYFNKNIEQAYRYYQRTYCNGRVCRFYLDMKLH